MIKKKRFNEAESYGWVVNEDEAKEAYYFFCDHIGKEEVDDAIVESLSVDELASSLAFLFRMYEFEEWYKRNSVEDDYDEFEKDDIEAEFESVNRRSRKSRRMSEARSSLSPQYDSRKSFYNKAHVVTDDDGTEILYSYDTPVVEIRNGEVILKPEWSFSATTLRHVKEFLRQRGFEAGSKAQIARMYGGANESLNRRRMRRR